MGVRGNQDYSRLRQGRERVREERSVNNVILYPFGGLRLLISYCRKTVINVTSNLHHTVSDSHRF